LFFLCVRVKFFCTTQEDLACSETHCSPLHETNDLSDDDSLRFEITTTDTDSDSMVKYYVDEPTSILPTKTVLHCTEIHVLKNRERYYNSNIVCYVKSKYSNDPLGIIKYVLFIKRVSITTIQDYI